MPTILAVSAGKALSYAVAIISGVLMSMAYHSSDSSVGFHRSYCAPVYHSQLSYRTTTTTETFLLPASSFVEPSILLSLTSPLPSSALDSSDGRNDGIANSATLSLPPTQPSQTALHSQPSSPERGELIVYDMTHDQQPTANQRFGRLRCDGWVMYPIVVWLMYQFEKLAFFGHRRKQRSGTSDKKSRPRKETGENPYSTHGVAAPTELSHGTETESNPNQRIYSSTAIQVNIKDLPVVEDPRSALEVAEKAALTNALYCIKVEKEGLRLANQALAARDEKLRADMERKQKSFDEENEWRKVCEAAALKVQQAKNTEIHRLEEKLEKQVEVVKSQDEKLQGLEKTIARLEADKVDLEAEVSQGQESGQQQEQLNRELESEKADLDAELEQYAKEVQRLQGLNIKHQADYAAVTSELARNEAEYHRQQESESKLREDYSALEAKLDQVNADNRRQKETLDAVQDENTRLNFQFAQAEQSYRDISRKLKIAKKRLSERSQIQYQSVHTQTGAQVSNADGVAEDGRAETDIVQLDNIDTLQPTSEQVAVEIPFEQVSNAAGLSNAQLMHLLQSYNTARANADASSFDIVAAAPGGADNERDATQCSNTAIEPQSEPEQYQMPVLAMCDEATTIQPHEYVADNVQIGAAPVVSEPAGGLRNNVMPSQIVEPAFILPELQDNVVIQTEASLAAELTGRQQDRPEILNTTREGTGNYGATIVGGNNALFDGKFKSNDDEHQLLTAIANDGDQSHIFSMDPTPRVFGKQFLQDNTLWSGCLSFNTPTAPRQPSQSTSDSAKPLEGGFSYSTDFSLPTNNSLGGTGVSTEEAIQVFLNRISGKSKQETPPSPIKPSWHGYFADRFAAEQRDMPDRDDVPPESDIAEDRFVRRRNHRGSGPEAREGPKPEFILRNVVLTPRLRKPRMGRDLFIPKAKAPINGNILTHSKTGGQNITEAAQPSTVTSASVTAPGIVIKPTPVKVFAINWNPNKVVNTVTPGVEQPSTNSAAAKPKPKSILEMSAMELDSMSTEDTFANPFAHLGTPKSTASSDSSLSEHENSEFTEFNEDGSLRT